jgi:hypothetical protein
METLDTVETIKSYEVKIRWRSIKIVIEWYLKLQLHAAAGIIWPLEDTTCFR